MPTFESAGDRVIQIEPLHLQGEGILKFPTIITQFNDSWSPSWRQEGVYGRMDPLSIYGGTMRKLQIGFRVIAESLTEARTNMMLLQKLVQWQYPVFVKNSGPIRTIKKPPYFKLKFLNCAQMGSKPLQGYFNAPIVINPGFQTKDKAQFFSPMADRIYFSDVEINLQMVVLHQNWHGWFGDARSFGTGKTLRNYPYNIPGAAKSSTSPRATEADLNRLLGAEIINGVRDPAREAARTGAAIPTRNEVDAERVDHQLNVWEKTGDMSGLPPSSRQNAVPVVNQRASRLVDPVDVAAAFGRDAWGLQSDGPIGSSLFGMFNPSEALDIAHQYLQNEYVAGPENPPVDVTWKTTPDDPWAFLKEE